MAGLWFDDLVVGQVFDHAMRRTVTETDNVLFTTLTHNPALLHLDEEYMKGTEFGARIVNSVYTLGLMVGISVGDTTLGTAIANLGWDEVRFPKPLFHGDTVRVTTEVIDLRESKSRPDAGIVTFLHKAFNQHGDLVASCKRTGLQRRLSGRLLQHERCVNLHRRQQLAELIMQLMREAAALFFLHILQPVQQLALFGDLLVQGLRQMVQRLRDLVQFARAAASDARRVIAGFDTGDALQDAGQWRQRMPHAPSSPTMPG